jgi:hypothetical protein
MENENRVLECKDIERIWQTKASGERNEAQENMAKDNKGQNKKYRKEMKSRG